TNIDIEKDDKDAMVTVEKKEEIIEKIKEFLEDKSNFPKILVYKRPFIQLDVLGIPRERK
ncbi:MAG: hypothetical protein QXT38_03440, partial [Candidatus Aenigmatarchaeota archaeon]